MSKNLKLSNNAMRIAEKRYLKTDMQGNVVETITDMFQRVANHIAKAEINWGDANTVQQMSNKFYERMSSFKFVVAGKAMFEAGNSGGSGQMSSCFVLPIQDDMKQIFKTLGDAALVHKNNGGTGFNFSKIRPRGDKVKNVPGSASGPVDFISVFSAALSKILQGSKRQGANIAILNVDHPDILDFIDMKNQDGTIKNFNISIGITNKFLQAVERDEMWELINPRNGEVVKKIRAKSLFNKISESAWATGDPGLAFLDRMEEDNPTPNIGKLDATNPCGEIALLPYESCNLTSIVLSNHLIKINNKYQIDWKDLEKSIKIGVRLLDNMIEVNTYPIIEIENMVKNGNRRIGLGVMGFAHMLYLLKIPYNSKDAVALSERLAKFIRRKSEEESISLASIRGVFPNWDRSIYAGTAEKYRNCATTMIAPTGTTSMLAEVSSGIEPVFSLVTRRKTFFEDDKNNKPTEEMVIIDPVFKQFLQNKFSDNNIRDKILNQVAINNNLEKITELTENEKKIFVTSHQIDPKWHIKIQAAWQKYFDNSISKTINFPKSASVEDIKSAYMMAWKLGCKGITIYRDGSKQNQVLNLSSNKLKLKKKKTILSPKIKKKNKCPDCGAKLNNLGNKKICYQCGYVVNSS